VKCSLCRCALQQCKCIVKSAGDVKCASDPVFVDLSSDVTGEISCFGAIV